MHTHTYDDAFQGNPQSRWACLYPQEKPEGRQLSDESAYASFDLMCTAKEKKTLLRVCYEVKEKKGYGTI